MAIYLTEKGLSEARNELNYLARIRRPRLVRLMMSIPLVEDAMFRSIQNERLLVNREIAELSTIIRRAKIIRGVDIERVPIGTKSKIKSLADK